MLATQLMNCIEVTIHTFQNIFAMLGHDGNVRGIGVRKLSNFVIWNIWKNISSLDIISKILLILNFIE